MRVFTKLGLSLLAVMISASVVWAQSSVENGPKKPHSAIVSDAQFDLQFEFPVGVGGGEAGIETDGSYIYTTKWNGGDFYKYQLDGTFLETFTCGSASNVRDLAFDGTYFYGAAANTSLFQMDFNSQTTVSTITAPTDCRALAYNEDDGYFYANNWGTDITVFDMSGAFVNSFPVGPTGDSYYGFAYDNYSGGTYLWGYAQVGATLNELIQIDLPAGTETGLTFDVGSVLSDYASAGGLCIDNNLVTGYWTIMGTSQNVNIWGLELAPSGPLPGNDVGIQSIVAPSSGMGLGNAEAVTVTVKNFGTEAQSNFDVSYTLDGGTPVTETITETINGGESIEHTFGTTVDLSAYGTYTFEACTYLAGDEVPDNDCKTKTVENSEPAYCDASTTTEDEYIANVLCGDIDNTSGWQGGVADYTDQSTSIDAGGSVDIVVTNGNAWASDKVTVWVDWNDDFVFEQGGAEEFVLENVGGSGESFTGAIVAPADAMAGDHRMRVRMTYSSDPEPCGNSSYGEVEDYTMTVGGGGGGNALFADDFEAYTVGQQLACQNPDDWTTWSMDPCNATEDPYISDTYAYGGSNSVNIVNDNDLVKQFGEEGAYLTTGSYKISFYMYIPTGNDAYWNTMSDFGANNAWAMEAYYDNGTGTLNAAGNATATTFTYSYDTWMYNELMVDLDADMAQFYIDGNMIFEWQWSLGGGLVQLAANDFYGYQQTNPCSYFVDDYAIEEISAPPVLDPPTNLAATVSGTDVTLTWDAPGGGGGTGEWIEWDDGINADDGIGLTGGGTFYVASHWEPADLTAYDGQYLTKISFFPYSNAVAATFVLKVWSGENAGTLLLSQDVASYTAGEWTEVTLDTPVMIDASQEFWFGYEVTHPDGENPAGVDAGPAVQYKGDMLSFDAASWVSMSAEYGLDFNWNLAGYVEGGTDATVATPMVKNSVSNPSSGTLAQATNLIGANTKFNPASGKALTGYNVYRDGENIGNTTETTYTDMGLAAGTYEYYVTAVYDEGESDPSNTVTVEVTGGGGGGVVYEDDFEAYNVGEQLACQNPDDWTTWSEDPCNATEDPYVSDAQAHSGTNSVNIVSNNDCVKPIENYTSGKYKMSFYIYVPTGADGYWNTLQDFAGANSQWGMQVYFGLDATGAGSVDAGGAGAGSFTFNYDTWIYNELIVDLDADWAELYIDGDLIVEWVWSTGAFGSNSLNQLGGNNFYGWTGGVNGNSNYYFDDYKLESMSTSPCENFDALTVGGYAAEQLGDPWTTWSGAPGGPEDAIVSDDYSVSPSNSFTINAATVDFVRKLADNPIATGAWLYSHSIYVPSGYSGYFNVQSEPTPGVAWVMEVFFDDGGAGHFAINGTNTDFTYSQDAWLNVEINFDLDSDLAWVKFDGQTVLEFENTNTIGGIDYYGSNSGGDPGAYYDDVCFGPGEPIVPSNCEDFDALTVGGYVAEQLGDPWSTWSGAPGGPEDAIVSDDYSVSPSNSFTVNAGTIDCIFKFGDDPVATGAWLYSNNIYVPSGYSGYFNVQSEPTPGVAWVMELFFDDGGAGHFMIDGVQTDFTYSQDTWINVAIDFDLDTDLGWVKFDDVKVLDFATTNTIGGIDFYGANSGGDPGAYYDDVCFGPGEPISPPPPPPPPTNLVTEIVNNTDIQLNWDAPGGGPTGSILCVDRDGSSEVGGLGFTDDWQYIEPALIANGFTYDYFEVEDVATQDGPDLATMEQYDIIIWFTGESWQNGQTMTDNDQANLAAYLDNGGHLLLSGQDYFYDKYPSAGNFSAGQFPYDYLGVTSTTQDNWNIFSPDVASVSGVSGSFADGVSFTVQDIYTTAKDGLYIDQISTNGQDLFEVTDPTPAGIGGCQYDGGSFKTVFTSVSLAAIVEADALTTLLGNAVNWLSPGSKELTGYNVYYSYESGPYELLVNTTETSYLDVDPGYGLHCYKVTAVYDDLGESEPTNVACETITGVDEHLADAINVYPNPATDVVNVKSDVQINSVKVYNYAGQVIVNEEINSMMYQLNTSQYQSGIYFFQIETDEGTISKRIIIQ